MVAMAIYRLIEDGAFDPDTVALMSGAYEDTLRALNLSDRSDPITQIVAQKILELVREGERDPVRLRDRAVQSLSR
jgi:hypothetical protein